MFPKILYYSSKNGNNIFQLEEETKSDRRGMARMTSWRRSSRRRTATARPNVLRRVCVLAVALDSSATSNATIKIINAKINNSE